jgi:hypothetical protein
MRECKTCKKEFSILVEIDGKIRNLGSRSRCLDCSPFGSHNTSKVSSEHRPARIDQFSPKEFADLVKNSISRSDIFDKLKMRKSGASFTILNRRIEREKVDTSHFRLGGELSDNRKYSNEELFVKNSPNSTYRVRQRVIKDNLIDYRCKECGISEWQGKKITLELDHINGDRYDNRLVNLRFLCPNCHSQTETFGGKNMGD